MRVVVTGSRDFDDVEVVAQVLNGIWDLDPTATTIIQGECPYGGADELAKLWAEEWHVGCLSFPPAKRTAQEYHARNRAMVDTCGKGDLVVAFVNKPLAESRGTYSTVSYARKMGVKTIVVEVIK